MFEIIKGLAGNSTIVGIGMGRSSAGYGVIAGLEALDALRTVKNISFGSGSGYTVSPSLNGVTTSSNNTLNNDDYKNKVIIPPPFENKGGDGAVIITW